MDKGSNITYEFGYESASIRWVFRLVFIPSSHKWISQARNINPRRIQKPHIHIYKYYYEELTQKNVIDLNIQYVDIETKVILQHRHRVLDTATLQILDTKMTIYASF